MKSWTYLWIDKKERSTNTFLYSSSKGVSITILVNNKEDIKANNEFFQDVRYYWET